MLDTKVKAPELDGAVGWLNTEAPLTLQQLRGKIVLLDFWTFCCVDCMHILPYLRRLEHEFAQELVVIGVHSAKFNNEKSNEQIAHAIARYGIEHPVANDARFALWERYWVREWPTLVLIDPDGYIVQRVACSENPHGKFEEPIKALIAEFDKLGKINRQPVETLAPQTPGHDTGWLRYPDKIAVDERFIYIADTGHNRILVADHDMAIAHVVGDGEPGCQDGSFRTARFTAPQGVALRDGALYVADTENHRIRRIDFQSQVVETLCCTGEKSSPWDLIWHHDSLYICMAGTHQIWCYDARSAQLRLHAGSGFEALKDGEPKQAHFAQPSGIATDGKQLYVADAETSSIRIVPCDEKGTVRTIVGEGLFVFGDRDGERKDVLLQHPLSVAVDGKRLLVADSYNHKIKEVDIETGSTATFCGSVAGFVDGTDARFAEPGGLCLFGGCLYVADTNNHAIRKIDLNSRQTTTLKFHSSVDPQADYWPGLRELMLAPHKLRPGSNGSVCIHVQFASGFHLNSDAESPVEIAIDGQVVARAKLDAGGSDIAVRWPDGDGAAELTVTGMIVYCADAEGAACHMRSLRWKVPLEFDAAAAGSITVSHRLPD